MVQASLDQRGLTLAGEQREVAQARILRAGGVALAARGLAATVDDVAEAAGVSRRTIFRHFATRDALFVTVIRAGIRRYAEQIPAPPPGDDLRGWLPDLLAVTHRLNARNGRVFWDLVGVRAADLSADLVMVAAECRDSRNRFAAWVTEAPAVDFRGSAAARCVAALARAAGWLEPAESAAGEAAVPPGGLPKEQADTTSAMARPTNARSPLRRMRPNLARNGPTCGDVARDGG